MSSVDAPGFWEWHKDFCMEGSSPGYELNPATLLADSRPTVTQLTSQPGQWRPTVPVGLTAARRPSSSPARAHTWPWPLLTSGEFRELLVAPMLVLRAQEMSRNVTDRRNRHLLQNQRNKFPTERGCCELSTDLPGLSSLPRTSISKTILADF